MQKRQYWCFLPESVSFHNNIYGFRLGKQIWKITVLVLLVGNVRHCRSKQCINTEIKWYLVGVDKH